MSLTTLHPVHHEIMRRLMLGQSQRDIALDMGRNEMALSVIIRSPLFQMEYRKLKDREMEDILEIRQEVIEAGKMGAKLHRRVISGKTEDWAELATSPVDIRIRQRSATDMLALATRITKINSINPQEADGSASYERILEETVTTRKVVEKANGGLNGRVIENDPLTGEPVEDIESLLNQEESQEDDPTYEDLYLSDTGANGLLSTTDGQSFNGNGNGADIGDVSLFNNETTNKGN